MGISKESGPARTGFPSDIFAGCSSILLSCLGGLLLDLEPLEGCPTLASLLTNTTHLEVIVLVDDLQGIRLPWNMFTH
jgi:hypothetical protein